MKAWKKIFQANGAQKQTGVAIFISDKTSTKQKLVTRDKECHFILMKGLIHQEEIMLQWSSLKSAVVVAGNFVLCDQSMKVTDNKVSKKAEFYLSRKEEERRNTHRGVVSKAEPTRLFV
jgi:hypothetical protein